jgi:uncharacterized protein YyaL (SSP411 family)
MNALQNESSLYLQQHKHNPVNWLPWSTAAFELAEKEDKLVLISVGYSACHWCHVMEHESFENDEVAHLMNKHFICIKVDREERPDVDEVYMAAVQLMTQQGGWPLNCFTLPNGEPIFGGTYFPKDRWIHTLNSLQHVYTNDRDKVLEYAAELSQGVQRVQLISDTITIPEWNMELLHELVLRWSKRFDNFEGGTNVPPKFMLPNNYEFLLAYGQVYKDALVQKHVDLTLEKMMHGGIYDQVNGGFSRYSVDVLWKVPHFEKMLYDNGQMLSLYAQAVKQSAGSAVSAQYKRILTETVYFLEHEMLAKNGAFYSAIDADSDGEEGKYYVYSKAELNTLMSNTQQEKIVHAIFHIDQKGLWEHGNYILMRKNVDHYTAQELELSMEEFYAELSKIRENLREIRENRVRPGTDTKCLTSWNAITIKGLCDAYDATGEIHFLDLAKRCGHWLIQNQLQSDGSLWRVYYQDGGSKIDGFLEDYAHSIAGFLALFQCTNETYYLQLAEALTNYTKANFQCEITQLFFTTKDNGELIARKMEYNDNVIPSSNSTMAHNLIKLGLLTSNTAFVDQAQQMLANICDGMEHFGSGYSAWAMLWLQLERGATSLKIKSNLENSKRTHKNLRTEYLPQLICSAILIDESEDTIFELCKNNSCQLPTHDYSTILSELT